MCLATNVRVAIWQNGVDELLDWSCCCSFCKRVGVLFCFYVEDSDFLGFVVSTLRDGVVLSLTTLRSDGEGVFEQFLMSGSVGISSAVFRIFAIFKRLSWTVLSYVNEIELTCFAGFVKTLIIVELAFLK